VGFYKYLEGKVYTSKYIKLITMLNPKTFKCTKCGECCRPIVKISDNEIKRIESLGLKRENFTEDDGKLNSKVLKQKNGVCMFLKRSGDEFICSIYDHRPRICQKYPFIKGNEKLEDCRPTGWERWTEIKKLLP